MWTLYGYNEIVEKAGDKDYACRTYLWALVRNVLWIVTGLKFITMLYTFANTVLLWLCSGTSELTD